MCAQFILCLVDVALTSTKTVAVAPAPFRACAIASAFPVLLATVGFRLVFSLVNVTHITTIAVAFAHALFRVAPAIALAIMIILAYRVPNLTLSQLTIAFTIFATIAVIPASFFERFLQLTSIAATTRAVAPAIDAVAAASAVAVIFASVGTELVLRLINGARAPTLALAPVVCGARAFALAFVVSLALVCAQFVLCLVVVAALGLCSGKKDCNDGS